MDDTTDADDDDEVTVAIHTLCRSLQRADTTTKDQLQALQTFRNKLVHLANGGKLTTSTEAIWGIYQLLLEWSLSYETPFPFQRAVQSLLKSIGQLLSDESDTGAEKEGVILSKRMLQSIIP